MVADTYDPLLGLLEMGTGNQNNSWGSSFNSSVTTPLGRAIAGAISRNNTGGTIDLSGSPPPAGLRQDIDYIQNFNGGLVSHLTVIVPNLPKSWLITNNTGGAFNLYIKTTAGTATQIPQGTAKLVYCDGNNTVKRLDDEEIGVIQMSGKAAVGPGELGCNGASLLRTDYPDLFGKIGTTWGAVDGTHFTLPNFTNTGRFPRSSSGSLTVGTYQANQNLAHTHDGSGTTSTTGIDHTHPVTGTTGTESVVHSHSYLNGASSGIQKSANHTHSFSVTSGTMNSNLSHNHTYSFTTTSNGGTEARPESAVVLMCIRY
jgi:microcystin-dependent protein